MIEKDILTTLYVEDGKSMQEIAEKLGCSVHKVQYWMQKHSISRRSIGDALYQWHNPDGDPFVFIPPKSTADYQLYGLGIGLYWGEGTKSNKTSVRLGNTDPELVRQFLQFLLRFYRVDLQDFRFGLQIFSDVNPNEALDFWEKKIKISRRQFYKTTVTQSGSIGTYRKKNKYGVLTIYYNNRNLRNHLIGQLAALAQG
ncbi:hypothetical protein CL635_01780 [bacterium]|nr:hypothetical protein [bacterium]|tara:strand:+ start:19501 stop:20097 length:597 start_codon:yes stop_codon:yes gene_type:complete